MQQEIEKSILFVLKQEQIAPNEKQLRKCSMKSFKGQIPDKKQRKKDFSQALTSLINASFARMKDDGSETYERCFPKDNDPMDKTILLFYAYCVPQMTRSKQDNAIAKCYQILSELKVTGRLRIGREGYNATLVGQHNAMRQFTTFLRVK